MPKDTNPFPEWLEEVANDPVTINTSDEGLLSECRENLWTFSLSQNEAEATSADDAVTFLASIMQFRERQIKARPGPITPMIFYCWFDEQASQLRFSLVSASHKQLPFLSSRYHNGIPLSEFITQEEADKRNLPEPPPHVLLAAAKTLPTR